MRRTAQLLAGIALLGGCAGDPTAASARTTAANASVTATIRPRAEEASEGSERSYRKDLATLRRVTAPFHSFRKAVAAGWSTQITPCMTDPAGGMGFHYGNTALIDGVVRVDQPELLLYEPEEGGRLRLVAVEYIVPLSKWTSAAPPRLFGQDFHVNTAFQIWALHVWVWKHNPSGLFADWNPRVDCDGGGAESAESHS